jgi:hypothetical protein
LRRRFGINKVIDGNRHKDFVDIEVVNAPGIIGIRTFIFSSAIGRCRVIDAEKLEEAAASRGPEVICWCVAPSLIFVRSWGVE